MSGVFFDFSALLRRQVLFLDPELVISVSLSSPWNSRSSLLSVGIAGGRHTCPVFPWVLGMRTGVLMLCAVSTLSAKSSPQLLADLI